MIRINRDGLTKLERESVRRPFAKNDGGRLDIGDIKDNVDVVLDKYGKVFSAAIANIDKDGGQGRS